MWNWISCYLSGKHEFGVSCEPGNVFLKCVHCGKRSQGWALHGPQNLTVRARRDDNNSSWRLPASAKKNSSNNLTAEALQRSSTRV